jgi:2-succinyl-5-enolpyruvyl-6-hydroxy-3-cyclohexene-1-carboxylate synthase
MPVRYAQLSWSVHSLLPGAVYANRGTSGIDGCCSTMIGHALSNKKRLNVLLTGDMAFFYDRNAFWHDQRPSNIRIIVLNNHGGGIFRLIEGPSKQPELEDYFETRQQLTTANTASDFGLEYHRCDSREELEKILPLFLDPDGGPKLLEIMSDGRANQVLWKTFNSYIKQMRS